MSILDGADAKTRKEAPIFSGFFKYFPDAIVEVARLSKIGNDQHNPGQPLHWSKHKSSDHGDCITRHQLDAGSIDTDKVRHSTKVAWRALAQLQIELEAEAAGSSVEEYLAYLTGKAEAKSDNEAVIVTCAADGARIYVGAERRVGDKDRRKVNDESKNQSRRRGRGTGADRRAGGRSWFANPTIES